MTELTKNDLRRVVNSLPKDVKGILATTNKVYLGGGFIRDTIAGNPVSDIDLFTSGLSTAECCAGILKNGREGSRIHKSPNAITLLTVGRTPIQFITRWLYDDPLELAKSFDFTVCQAVVWNAEGLWRSDIHPDFYSDLAAKRLTYTFPARNEDAGGSMLRVRKFLNKGYNIQPGSLAGVMARVFSRIEFTKLGRSPDSWDYEEAIAKVISGLLLEVDPMNVVDGIDVMEKEDV